MCGSRGGGAGSRTPLKNHKTIRFSSNTGPDPLKNRSYQASIQCWVIIGTPAKRHLMAFRWRADGGPLIVVPASTLPSSTKQKQTKKVVKVGPPLTKLSGSALLLSSFDLFSKLTFFNKIFKEHYLSVKRHRPRSGPTFCWSRSGSQLFAKVISRRQKFMMERVTCNHIKV